MAIRFRVVDPRQDILARFDAEIAMAGAATSRKVKRSHEDRAHAFRVSLELVDCYFRTTDPYPREDNTVDIRSLDEIRDDVQGGGIVRG